VIGAAATPESHAPVASAHRRGRGLIRHGGVVFWLMFLINVVNYLDRFIAAAVGPTLKLEFHLADDQIGILSTAFLFVYTIAGLPLGLLADRISRARIVAVGVGVWSVFSGYTAFASGFGQLFLSRVGVGIGESSYLPAGTALLSSYNPFEKRARVLSRWGSGQLVGVALAFIVTAVLFHIYSPFSAWRVAFFVTALPGLLLALGMWFVADAPSGAAEARQTEEVQGAAAEAHGHLTLTAKGGIGAIARDFSAHVAAVWRIPTIRVAVVVQALSFIVVTPAVIFLPIYVASKDGPFHLNPAQVSLVSGVMLVFGGLTGAVFGGNIADWLGRRYQGSRVLTAAVGGAVGLPCYVITLLTHDLPLFVASGTIAIFAFTIGIGPLTAAIQDATPPALRGTAIAVTLLLAHLGGDIWAPTVVGKISTALHERTSLALLLVGVPALALATIVAYRGARIHADDVAAQQISKQAAVEG
jgi:MFS family permease